MTHPSFGKKLGLCLLLLAPQMAPAQPAPAADTLTISGYAGKAPVVQVNGKSYVDLESLARLTSGSLSFQGSQVTLTLHAQVAKDGPSPSDDAVKTGFSRDFLAAGVEEMTVIREWRIAIVNAIQNNFPVTENWVSRYRRNAESKLALASAALSTEADRNGFPLLNNEFASMLKLSNKYLALRSEMTYTPPGSVENDPLDQQILACARGLASLAASGQYQDVSACH